MKHFLENVDDGHFSAWLSNFLHFVVAFLLFRLFSCLSLLLKGQTQLLLTNFCFFPDIISMLFLNFYKVIKPNIDSRVTAIEWTQKFYQTIVLHLLGKKYLFLLIGATRNGWTLALSLTILVNLSSVEAAYWLLLFHSITTLHQ